MYKLSEGVNKNIRDENDIEMEDEGEAVGEEMQM